MSQETIYYHQCPPSREGDGHHYGSGLSICCVRHFVIESITSCPVPSSTLLLCNILFRTYIVFGLNHIVNMGHIKHPQQHCSSNECVGDRALDILEILSHAEPVHLCTIPNIVACGVDWTADILLHYSPPTHDRIQQNSYPVGVRLHSLYKSIAGSQAGN